MSSLEELFDTAPEATQTGLFAEAAEAMNELNTKMSLNLEKADMILESVNREYELNISQAELKCMKEHGTTDDLMYLEEAAEEGAIGKFKKMIDTIIRMWKDFCSNIRNKIVSKICSAEARSTLNKAEKKIKLNPFLAKKKVEVPNIKKPIGVIHSYMSTTDKMAAKTIKGIVTEQTATSLAKTKEKYREDFNHSIAGKAAVITMSIAGVVAQLNTEIEKLPQFVDNCEKVNCQILEKLKSTVSDETAAAATAATQACMNFRTELAKEELNQHISYVTDMMSALRKTVIKAKGNTEAKDIKESADDFDYLADESEIFGESGDDVGGFMDEDDEAFMASILGGY